MGPVVATLALVFVFLGAAYLLAEWLARTLIGSGYRRQDRANGRMPRSDYGQG